MAIFVVIVAGAAVLRFIGVPTPLPWLVVIGGAILLGETFELQPPGRIALPMSYAVFLVLGRVGTLEEVVVTLVVAVFCALLLRPGSIRLRLATFVWRVGVGMAGVGTFRLMVHWTGTSNTLELLAALGCASLTMIAVHEFGSALVLRAGSFGLRDRWPDVALFTSGALMALGFAGVGGVGVMGVWSLPLFAIPLFAMWYAFDRLAAARTTYWQTIHALALAPEFGGVVSEGHTERVAALAGEIGQRLDLSFDELETLEAAAYLHHIGDLCVDVATVDGTPLDPDPIAGVGHSVAILRDTGSMAAVADVVDAIGGTHRSQGDALPTESTVPGAILKAASAFDDLAVCEGHGPTRALALMYASPAYVYDPRVLSALERSVQRRGELSTPG